MIAFAANVEMVQRPFGLRTPVRIGADLNVAHRVLFSARGCRHFVVVSGDVAPCESAKNKITERYRCH